MAETQSTFTGSCHCGSIKYKVDLTPEQLSKKTASRCNCTYCQKPGFTSLSIAPTAFTLLSPGSKEEVADYVAKVPDCHRYFCTKCGVQILGEGKYEFEGKTYEFFSINFLTLDQPQDGLDLSEWKMMYFDALHDNWTGGLKEVPWSGGAL